VPVAVTVPSASSVAVTTVVKTPAEDLIRVDEVWLLDRGNDTYDWGISVTAVDPLQTRSNVVVDVRLIDERGDVVDATTRVVAGVDANSREVAIGRLVDPDVAPVRLEFDVSVGVATQSPTLDELIEVETVARSGDDLNVRVRMAGSNVEAQPGATEVDGTASAGSDPERALGVFVWRSGGAVVAVAFESVVLGSDGTSRFTVDLGPFDVPDGLPDDVLWARQY
jgi:hypothetical protein